MLKVTRDPEVKKNTQFADANDVLSSFPMDDHERREPTELEKLGRKKGWHQKPQPKKKGKKTTE